jgi:hypothetical protein
MYASTVVGVTLQALDEAVNGLEIGPDGHLNALDGEILDTALRLAAGSVDDTEAPRTPA